MNDTTATIAPPEKSEAKVRKTYSAKAYSAQSPTSPLAPGKIQRRAPRPQDIQIEILYCGVCHSDLHQVRNEWEGIMPTVYPCVPGHEIVGRVVRVGSVVKKFKEGDIAAVGCMVDSCRKCPSCLAGEEQYCEAPADIHLQLRRQAARWRDLRRLFRQHRRRPRTLRLSVSSSSISPATAPLLCAGITTYSPLRHWKSAKVRKLVLSV